MRRNQFGWLLLAGSAALHAGACAETERNEREEGAAGSTGRAGSRAIAGAPALGGSASVGGEPAQAGGEPGHDFGGEAGQNTSGEAGAGGAPEPPRCGPTVPSAILGDYRTLSGDDLWLRSSGKAVTVARVPAGRPVSARLPELWQVVEACPSEAVLVIKSSATTFTRLDYLKGATSLTVCFAAGTATSAEGARALPAADRANTIDAGCNGEPWLRVTKEAK